MTSREPTAAEVFGGQTYADLRAERDALVEIVAMQMEAIQPPAANEQNATLQRLLGYYLLEVCGVSDWRPGETKLGALVTHIRRYYCGT